MVGGLLVVTAALGTWWAATDAGRAPAARYVVATRAIDPGQRIAADDLRVVPIDLPAPVASGSFTEVTAVAGAVALGPIAEGGLVQASAIAPATGTTAGREVSFAVETSWAVDGSLRPGDRIDVFATTAGGDDRTTDTVLTSALVRHVSRTDGGLGELTGLTITVAVADPDELGGAVSALRAADLTVARATGVTALERSGAGAAEAEGRGDPMPNPSTTTTPRSRRPAATSTTTTTTRPGAGS